MSLLHSGTIGKDIDIRLSCNNNVLSTLPSTNGPFTLTASNPTAPFNGETVEASGLHFYIGAGPGSYCPVPSVPQATCDTYPGTNTTMFSSALVGRKSTPYT